MRKFLIAIVAVLVIAAAAFAWLLSDPNRFKPQLADLIKRQSGLAVTFAGYRFVLRP